MEICHILQLLNLHFEVKVLLKLFQSFKTQLFYFLQYFQQTQQKFGTKESTNEKEKGTLNEDLLGVVAKLLEKIDYRNPYFVSSNCNKYERLEKSKFFLEQEALELEAMLRNYKDSKDEVEHFLRNKVNLKKIEPSGVYMFLQEVLKNSRSGGLEDLENENGKIDFK